MISRFARPALVLAASAALGACTMYDYGYGGMSVGYASGGYYPYDSYYDPYGYYGWYDGYYYPGNGYYVYDNRGGRHRWSDNHRRYWEGRRGREAHQENWSRWRGEQFSGQRGDGNWQGQDRRGDGNWQGRDRQQWQGRQEGQRRSDRQGWQGRRQQGERAAPSRQTPQRAAPAQRERSTVNRGREFGRSKDTRDD